MDKNKQSLKEIFVEALKYYQERDSKTAEIIFVGKGFSLFIAFAVLIKDSPILLCEIINSPTLILKFLIFFYIKPIIK